MITVILLLILTGSIFEIAKIFEDLSNTYTTYDYKGLSKSLFTVFYGLFAISIYGYYHEPFPQVIPIAKLSMKVIYHGSVICTFMYIGAYTTWYVYKKIFRK